MLACGLRLYKIKVIKNIKYTTPALGPPEYCEDNYYYSEGNFTSPGYPSPYTTSAYCRWNFYVGGKQNIEFTFYQNVNIKSDAGCTSDNLQVFLHINNAF